MDDCRMFSAVYMRDHIRKTYKDVEEAIIKWPTSGDEIKNSKWILSKVSTWDNKIKGTKDFQSSHVAAVICNQCLTDLRDKTKDRYKVELLSGLVPSIDRILEFKDPTYSNFDMYDKANNLLKYLYELIEWE